MKSKMWIILALAGVLLWHNGYIVIDGPSPDPNVPVVPEPKPEPKPEPDVPVLPVVPEPTTLALKTLVQPIVLRDFEEDDAVFLTEWFLTLATIVDKEPQFIKTNSIFREFNVSAGSLTFAGTDLKGKYVFNENTLGTDINSIIDNAVGKKSVNLDDKMETPGDTLLTYRQKLRDTLRAIAWGVTK